MNIGMLWFDRDANTTLAEKIAAAVAYYKTKYGRTPNLCFVHPAMLTPGATLPEKVDVRPNRSILPNHFWIGVDNKPVS